MLPANTTIAGVLKQKSARRALARHKEAHQGAQLIKPDARIVSQKREDQRELPKWVGIIDGPQLPTGDRPLNPSLKGGRLCYAPGEPGQCREDQGHHMLRSA